MLSGRSDLSERPPIDFFDDCLLSTASGDPGSELLKDDTVLLVLVRPWLGPFFFIFSVYALIRCGEGGASMDAFIIRSGGVPRDVGSRMGAAEIPAVLGRRNPFSRKEDTSDILAVCL